MKTRSVFLVLVLLPALLCAQTLQTSKIDMSGAKAFPAGPDRVYVRGIVYDGEPISVVLAWDGENGAEVYGPYTDNDMFITDDIDLAYAAFTFTPEEALEIRGVIIGNSAYSGLFMRNGETGITLRSWSSVDLPETAETRLARLEADRKLLEDRIASLTAERDNAISRAEASEATLGSAQAASSMPANALWSGFRAGKALTGSWMEASVGVTQTDPSGKLSAYAIPVPEIEEIDGETLFTFRVGSAGAPTWNGFGMHFAQSDEGRAVFGFGDSYLLWLTSDPDGGAYLQLYRMGDRVRQIASYLLGDSIPSSIEIGLLYRPSDGTVGLLADGKLKGEFDASGIGLPGTTLVLRTFGGPVAFTDFSVSVK